MNQKLILSFLSQVAANNNRDWFHAHRDLYEAAHAEWEQAVGRFLQLIVGFDPEVGTQQVKDCMYRFYRDTRFSPDKSPYKTHFGAYINAHGKKALRGGYYIHLEPGACMLAVGNYWLPTNILTACRNEIMSNADIKLKELEGKSTFNSLKIYNSIEEAQQPERYLVFAPYLGIIAGIDGVGCIAHLAMKCCIADTELQLLIDDVELFTSRLVHAMILPQ